jgi:2'-5' RNA ligase
MATTVRAFVALQPPADLRETLWQGFAAARQLFPRGRWVPVDNLHLTLKFLGEVDVGKIKALGQLLDAATVSLPAYDVEMAGSGTFPAGEHPRVIWAGLAGGRERTAKVARLVEDACARIGVPPEKRPFQAHLTVARVGESIIPGPALEEIGRLSDRLWGRFAATEIVLMQSMLRPQGPLYQAISMHKLGS